MCGWMDGARVKKKKYCISLCTTWAKFGGKSEMPAIVDLHTLTTRYMYLHTVDFECTNLLRCKREVIKMKGFDISSLKGRDARL